MGVRDDTPLEIDWQDTRPTVHVRVNKDLSIADPFDDEIREVLPSLAATQRADAFFGPVFVHLETATTDEAEAWLKVAQPSDSLPDQPPSTVIYTATLVDIADDEGVLRRHRLRTRN